MGSRPSANSRPLGLTGDSVDSPSAQEIEFETPNNRGLYAASFAVFEGQGVCGTLHDAGTAPDTAIAVCELHLAHILALLEASLGADLPAEIDALAALEVQADVPLRFLEVASTLDRS